MAESRSAHSLPKLIRANFAGAETDAHAHAYALDCDRDRDDDTGRYVTATQHKHG